jgi:hypothetical protein
MLLLFLLVLLLLLLLALYEKHSCTLVAYFTGLPALVLPGGRQMGMCLPVG